MENNNCSICDAKNSLKFLYKKWNHTINRCNYCGTGFTVVDENFNTQEIYNENYFQGGQKDGYADYIGSEKVIRKEFHKIVKKLISYAKPQGRLLEIGCAYGFFLKEAKNNFDCIGIEVAESAAKYASAQGLTIYNQYLDEDFFLKKDFFDATVMLDVIEHLPDPAGTIKLLSNHLNKNGIIYITTGDFGSFYAKISKENWRLMTPPQHLVFFTKKGLIALLENNGFKILKCEHPWKIVPLGLIIYQITNRLGLKWKWLENLNSIGIPANLFDAMSIIAQKKRLKNKGDN